MALKILALHGYTQSGPFFQRKISKLQAHLTRSFPDVQFSFPTGIIRLRPSEKVFDLGSRQSTVNNIDAIEGDDRPDPDDIDAYAWHVLHDTQIPPSGLMASLNMLAEVVRTEGPFDGILGFSQGAVLAVMVASLLEGEARRQAFARAQEESPENVRYPSSFENLKHPPLKFGITYGALMGRGRKYAAFYQNPLVQTPFIHFCGRWDPVIGVDMAQAVVEAQIGGERCLRIDHPGAHIVPVGMKYLNAVSNFIADCLPEPKGTDFSPPLLEQPTTFQLPLQFVNSSIKRLRADSSPSVSDDSTSEESRNQYNQRRPRKIRVKSSVGFRTPRFPRRTTSTTDLVTESLAGVEVEIKILPSRRESIYLLPSGHA
ncbi:Family of serine hydrolases 3 [Lecanora helva]